MDMAFRAGRLFRQWAAADPANRPLPKVVVSSPLLRAMQTAAQFIEGAGMAESGVKVVLDPRVRETHGGTEDCGTPPSRWGHDLWNDERDFWDETRAEYAQRSGTTWLTGSEEAEAEWNISNWASYKDIAWLAKASWSA